MYLLVVLKQLPTLWTLTGYFSVQLLRLLCPTDIMIMWLEIIVLLLMAQNIQAMWFCQKLSLINQKTRLVCFICCKNIFVYPFIKLKNIRISKLRFVSLLLLWVSAYSCWICFALGLLVQWLCTRLHIANFAR